MIIVLLSAISLIQCSHEEKTEPMNQIDPRSYNLGIIGAFGEVVHAGVKQLAFSEALPPGEMDILMDEAQKIAERNGVLLYREKDLLVTDLFPADVAVGKHVLLIYRDSTLDQYMALKKEAEDLRRAGKYNGEEKKAISRRLGKLLSYPDEYINELMRSTGAIPAAPPDSIR